MGKIRTFLSLNTKPDISGKIAGVQAELKKQLEVHNIKWENPEKFHLTLRFLGDINEEKIPELDAVLDRLKFDFESIKFKTAGTGFFPNPRYPNVAFLALEELNSNTVRLLEFIDKIIYTFGVKPEKRFIPHITLGRFGKNKRTKIETPPVVEFEQFTPDFDNFCLMKSVLQPGGSVYEVINTYNF